MASPWKGKASDNSPEELNPVITYRHLLSSALGVRNPLRVCGLTDMDAFYAACEQNRLKLDPEIPLVVRQWDALIAVNYPARKFGITRMESIKSAMEKCPHLCVVHVATFDPSQPDTKPAYTDHPNSETHKVSLDYYRKESKKIMQIFKEMLPDAEVERASIDEAFIDFTEPVRKHILSLMPHLATPPSTGLDTPLPPPPSQGLSLPYPRSRVDPNNGSGLWENLGILVPLSGKPPEPLQPKGTITENQNLLPQTPQKQPSFLNDRPSPEDTRQTALSAYSWYANCEDAFMSGNGEILPPLQEVDDSNDEVSSETEIILPSWHDIALSIAASFLLRTRDEIKLRLGYTTSAGLARNKFLAKLVASYRKRDNQSILRNLAIPNYLRPIAFQKIRFLGGKLGEAIAETYEAQTVGDLLRISIEELQNKFGENSIWIWEILRGIDRSEVKDKPLLPKSMAASKNLHHPITHPSGGQHWLRMLSGELAFRLQEGRQENPGMWPRTLVLHVRHSYTISRSRQAPFLPSPNLGTEYIYKAAEKLWADLVGSAAEFDVAKAKGRSSVMKITNIALSFANVELVSSGQYGIERFFNKRKVHDSNSNDQQKGLSTLKRPKLDGSDDHVNLLTQTTPLTLCVEFYCERCQRHVQRDAIRRIEQDVALALLKLEHDDFHFAEDLATGDGDYLPPHKQQPDPRTKTMGNNSKPKRKQKTKGIEMFFQAKAGPAK